MDPGRLWDASGRPLDGRSCPGSVRPLAGLDALGPRHCLSSGTIDCYTLLLAPPLAAYGGCLRGGDPVPWLASASARVCLVCVWPRGVTHFCWVRWHGTLSKVCGNQPRGINLGTNVTPWTHWVLNAILWNIHLIYMCTKYIYIWSGNYGTPVLAKVSCQNT